MINPENIERIEITTRWVSVVASAVLLGLQVTKLVQSPTEDESVDDTKE